MGAQEKENKGVELTVWRKVWTAMECGARMRQAAWGRLTVPTRSGASINSPDKVGMFD